MMDALTPLLGKATAAPRHLTARACAVLLSLHDARDLEMLFAAARGVTWRHCGHGVALRGLVEAGNICMKDCLYCGIRKSNATVARYRLTADEIFAAAQEAKRLRYASLVIQSGEIASAENTRFYEGVLRRLAPLKLGITLSLGEQTEETYQRWRMAGATRYLLRIETSSRELYARIHPAGYDWQARADCLAALRRAGYQVGTGVMCALPGQTVDDLARDILFFAQIDADMIGMGPYIPHPDTPLADADTMPASERLTLALKMIAVTRLYLHDVNIAATTALAALSPSDGYRRGILAGANVLMPNVTDTSYRAHYHLYEGKPDDDENAATSRVKLERMLAAVDAFPLYDQRGDSRHFASRLKTASSDPASQKVYDVACG